MLSLLMASVLAAQPAASAPAPGLASIDYARGGGIRDWHAEDDRGIFVRDRANRWYYVAFSHPCPGVVENEQILFDTHGFDRFDRSSLVLTQTETCGVAAVDHSDAPRDKGGKATSRP